MIALTLPIVTLLLLFLRWRSASSGKGVFYERLTTWLLSGCVLLGISCWWGEAGLKRLHTWDLFHYYIGTKYFDELRYTGLYDCAVLVDQESADPRLVPSDAVRNLQTNGFVSVATLVGGNLPCRTRFTAERWGVFSQDIVWFRTALGDRWKEVFHDHGFNPSPVWIAVAKLLLPTTAVSEAVLHTIAMWDTLILVLLWGVLYFSFNIEAVAVAAVFWGTNSLGNGTWTGGAFLRHDWLLAVGVALACMRWQLPVASGIATAYASCLRIFPALLAIGVAIGARRERASLQELKSYFFGLVLGGASLITCSFFSVGTSSWNEFRENTVKHLDTRAGNLVGMQHLVDHVVQCQFVGHGSGGVCDPPERTQDTPLGWVRRVTAIFFAVGMLGWLRWVSRSLTSVDRMVCGVALLPIIMNPSSYYYEIFLIFGLLLPKARSMASLLLGLSVLLQLTAVAVAPPNKVFLVASILVVQFVVVLPLVVGRSRGYPPLHLESKS
jgi:hypothetical protein